MSSTFLYIAACVALLILWATTVVMDKYELEIPMLTLNEKLGIKEKE